MIKELFDLTGRIALVTGSTRGIGRAIALGLAEFGADVIAHGSRDIARADDLLREIQALGHKAIALEADLSTDETPRRLFDKATTAFGRVDILVLNASLQYRTPWQEIPRQQFTEQMTINFRASFELIQLFTPGMMERRWGRIVTVGSVQQVVPHPNMAIYAASKAAQLNLVQNLAPQLGRYGITINNLAPGVIDTDRNKPYLTDAEIYKRTLDHIPVGFVGQPEDCVGATLVLCSDAGRYITGSDFMVDGGWQWV